MNDIDFICTKCVPKHIEHTYSGIIIHQAKIHGNNKVVSYNMLKKQENKPNEQ